MQRNRALGRLVVFGLLVITFQNFSSDQQPLFTSPIARTSAFWFVPNQLAPNTWYRLDGQPVNGHFEDSFANLSLWPRLANNLRPNSGGLGLYSEEIRFISADSAIRIRQSRIPISVEAPAWTQC